MFALVEALYRNNIISDRSQQHLEQSLVGKKITRIDRQLFMKFLSETSRKYDTFINC